MVVVAGQGVHVGTHVTSPIPTEITLVHDRLNTIRVPRPLGWRPRRSLAGLIGDRGYDSDTLREDLADQGILVIAPYRGNRAVRRYEDGRHLRRHCHRWISKRTFA